MESQASRLRRCAVAQAMAPTGEAHPPAHVPAVDPAEVLARLDEEVEEDGEG